MSETTAVETGAQAAAALSEMIATLAPDQIVTLCRKAIEIATPISAWVLSIALTVAAQRFDRRSFINICEDIHRGEAA